MTESDLPLVLPQGATTDGYGTELATVADDHVLLTCIVGPASVRLVSVPLGAGATRFAKGLKGSLRSALRTGDGKGFILTEYGLHFVETEPLRVETSRRVPKHMSHLYSVGGEHLAVTRWFSKTTLVYTTAGLAEIGRIPVPTDLVLENESTYTFCSFQTGTSLEYGLDFRLRRRQRVPLGRTPIESGQFVVTLAGAPAPGDVPEPQRHARLLKLDRDTCAEVAHADAIGVTGLLGCDKDGRVVAQSARGIMLFDAHDLSLLAAHDTGRMVVAAKLVGSHSAALSFQPQLAGGIGVVRWESRRDGLRCIVMQ